ncbi:diaminopimelate epimerase [Aureimonas fodinaquatilis]|uniref:Diaminopimelate epimerase n=1 Tax=Aureimonas fodinaquatilis TaxID=2565783 RepID=A0A5B0DTF9_9HYPH|nr:diaminopimelate epimerase [Aureimonas fodinaquatilis]KAA0969726.1 diaminopimelate epimerase [Aureimonas fodinaquatilis]
MSARIPFSRMNGLGNEILVADMRGRADTIEPQAAIVLANDTQTRFDQIMAIHDPQTAGTDAFVRIINTDGSEAGACGNGTRCVVHYLSALNGQREFLFQTKAGLLEARALPGGLISVDMGQPRFDWQSIPLAQKVDDTNATLIEFPLASPAFSRAAVVSMGNPHAVFFVDADVNSIALENYGSQLEHHPLFPDRANISIAQVTRPTALTMRTWERGVGLTRACGSAACAASVLAARTGRAERRIVVTVPGGDLIIEWRDDDHVIMTGPAEWEWSGTLDPLSGAFDRDAERASA